MVKYENIIFQINVYCEEITVVVYFILALCEFLKLKLIKVSIFYDLTGILVFDMNVVKIAKTNSYQKA